ncbi:hypothetical protein HJC23_002699 [Cyclotella cryptica]|uniref:NADP-dependent oxidoreductase domain-containing protein n=1 Tax=Cyclotella cryptica TaxID=29204 RepID=A0ABD3PB20_9STRA|eukprot:CCRYP_016034-RA/>CCRYP_016034-RA protein AED:0.00 eAED:0.00 QI:399/1/1/1/0/0/2/98/456
MRMIRSTFFLASVFAGRAHSQDEGITTNLSNGIIFPFVGLGIGNLQHELIDDVVRSSLQADLDIRLIDTAHASRNEGILANAIVSSDKARSISRQTRGGTETLPPIHVVSKVWYTHLGYERTKISVREILEELGSVSTRQVYVHLLIHWPRCRDDIEWMNCAEEESNLPQHVRDTGPPPHLNKDEAWKGSWAALEDFYTEFSSQREESLKKLLPPIIASIGVSNFDINDMKSLLEVAKIKPHIYQGDIWLAFHDPLLFRYIRDNHIFFQAYGVMNRIIQRRDESPSAFSILSDIAREVASTMHASGQYEEKSLIVTEATIVLAFCVQYGIGVIPRASSQDHRHENSPSVIAAVIPYVTSGHFNQLQLAVPAIMKGEDLHASISFMNSLLVPIQIHWIHAETGQEILVKDIIHPGSVEVIQSHPGHRFVAYDTEREVRREVAVDVGYGQRQHFTVEL